ncbi:MAG TPA: hypothetical protein VK989_13270 [Polyangia bacterium]|nr:hypothetical protein [Polyangia bacterium]
MSRCKGCGAEFRRGLKRSLLLPSGDVVGAIVCRACASRALSILTPTAPPPAPAPVIEGREQLEHVRRNLRTFLALEEARQKTPDLAETIRQYSQGRIDGLLSATTLISAILTEKRTI